MVEFDSCKGKDDELRNYYQLLDSSTHIHRPRAVKSFKVKSITNTNFRDEIQNAKEIAKWRIGRARKQINIEKVRIALHVVIKKATNHNVTASILLPSEDMTIHDEIDIDQVLETLGNQLINKLKFYDTVRSEWLISHLKETCVYIFFYDVPVTVFESHGEN